nr:hypothetical protein [Candidatus Enterousia merdequi]
MQKKSDFKRFCETMWAMSKYNIVPWILVASLIAGVAIGVKELKQKDVKSTFVSQKQR